MLQKLDLTPCKAPVWADSGHGQTLWAHFLKSPSLENLGKNFEVGLPDGDRLSCFYLPGPSNIVISLFHGLSGDVHADYMQRTAILCQKMGHTVVLVNHRGAGHGAAMAKHPYHSGRAEDISAVLENLRMMFPNRKQIAVGYSMSANIVLCLLGGALGGNHKPDGAVTVNAPINLERGSKLLKAGLNRLYDFRFVNRLRKELGEKHRKGLLEKKYPVFPWTTVHDFDQIYTAPASGFKDREDYYQTCSAMNYLSDIKVPTHILTAQDDPFVSVEDYFKASFSKFTQLHIEPRGGHLGYLSQSETPIGSNRWLDYYLWEAFKSFEKLFN